MFGGRAHKIYGDKIVRQRYAPGFVLPLVLKDVRLALAEAERAGAPMPSVERGARPADHRNRARLRRSRLDRARPDRCGGGGTHAASRRVAVERLPRTRLGERSRRSKIMTSQAEALEIDMELTDIPGTSLKVSPRRDRHLGHWRLDVGRNRRSRIHFHHPRRVRAWHQSHRHCSGLWIRPLRGDRRQGDRRGQPALARADCHQGRT